MLTAVLVPVRVEQRQYDPLEAAEAFRTNFVLLDQLADDKQCHRDGYPLPGMDAGIDQDAPTVRALLLPHIVADADG